MATKANNIVRQSATVIKLSGAGKAKREVAFMQIAPLSFVEGSSRVATIDNMKIALGPTPSEMELETAKDQWVIGRAAARMPAGEFPKGTIDDADKLEYVSDLVLHYSMPLKEGTNAATAKLRKGKKGYRSILQQRVIRNAEECWSLVKAELGLVNVTTAKPLAERNKGKRAARAGGKVASKSAPPSHSQLVKQPGNMSADECVAWAMQTAVTAMQVCKANAKHMPVAISTLYNALHRDITKAVAEYNDRKTKAASVA